MITGSALPGGIGTLIFDVLGTVVDEAGSIEAEVGAALAAAGAGPGDGRPLTVEWARRLDALTDQVAAGHAPWRSNDALRRAALLDVAAAADLGELSPALVGDPARRGPARGDPARGDPARGGLALDDLALDDLALVGHRLAPWPDSAGALRALSGAFTVIALSNAGLAQLADMSAAGGLAWHGVLSGELVKAYKPDPAVYRMALDLLELNPRQTLMVAAHPWDLRAAASHGMRTAYVSRPGEGVPAPDDHFDVSAQSLADLSALLVPTA